jgi:diguanylate cyclase (GGDEF)-like protein
MGGNVDNFTPQTLTKVIARHPRASLQDALLLFVLMLAALLLALQYDLFFFIDQLSDAQRQVSIAEAIFLTVMLTACLFAFVLRRLRDQRSDAALKAAAEVELRELTELALQDPLTGLLNRRALMEALMAAVKAPPTDGSEHALFLMDLNGFKRVNDVHGHQCGDHVLEVVAERFRSAARPSDLVARIGGDEFAVLAYNVDRESAGKVGTRFVQSLNSPIRAATYIHEISMAIGVALIPENGATAEDAFRNADKAMYQAKATDSSLVFFEPAMDAQKRIA